MFLCIGSLYIQRKQKCQTWIGHETYLIKELGDTDYNNQDREEHIFRANMRAERCKLILKRVSMRISRIIAVYQALMKFLMFFMYVEKTMI